MGRPAREILLLACVAVLLLAGCGRSPTADRNQPAKRSDALPATQVAFKEEPLERFLPPTKEWSQWGRTSARNNVAIAHNLPDTWDVQTGENVKWSAKLGSQTYGSPVVAGSKVFIGTNNAAEYVKRFKNKDLGCLLCFRAEDGTFLWQFSAEKLPTGRVNDWPQQGIASTPLVEGNRLWFVSNRCELVCLDTEGFYDGQNDGPYRDEANTNRDEADIVWKLDMIGKLGVFPHNLANGSPTSWGNLLFVGTGNGVDEAHLKLPSPRSPSFLAVDMRTGKIVWEDRSPDNNILHGQWCSPCVGVFDGVPQVIFGGGDGWMYSFRADRWQPPAQGIVGRPEQLWKFDCNPKPSKWELGGRGDRNNVLAFPVIHDGLVYQGVGQDPEHGDGVGHLWCIDPTKRGDVSPEIEKMVGGKKVLAANPNSAVVWHYGSLDQKREPIFRRTISSPAIAGGLLFVPDFTGYLHCLDPKTGRRYWEADLISAVWGSPLIAGDRVLLGNEDGDIAVFPLSKTLQPNRQSQPNMGASIHGTPAVANEVFYVATRNTLYAITNKDE